MNTLHLTDQHSFTISVKNTKFRVIQAQGSHASYWIPRRVRRVKSQESEETFLGTSTPITLFVTIASIVLPASLSRAKTAGRNISGISIHRHLRCLVSDLLWYSRPYSCKSPTSCLCFQRSPLVILQMCCAYAELQISLETTSNFLCYLAIIE